MSKLLIVIISCLVMLSACSSDSQNAELTKKEMLIGTWRVTLPIIDTVPYPVTSPGFGDIRATFTATNYTYTFPAIDENNNPISGTSSITGTWSLSADESKILLDRTSVNLPVFEWEILQLSIGTLKTKYIGPKSGSTTETSVYEITYTLSN